MTGPEKNPANLVVLSLKLQQPIIAAITKFCWYYGRFAKDVLYGYKLTQM